MLNTGHSSKKLMGTTADYAFVLQLLSSVGWVYHSVSSRVEQTQLRVHLILTKLVILWLHHVCMHRLEVYLYEHVHHHRPALACVTRILMSSWTIGLLDHIILSPRKYWWNNRDCCEFGEAQNSQNMPPHYQTEAPSMYCIDSTVVIRYPQQATP